MVRNKKKYREGILNDSSVSLDHGFTKGLKSSEYLHILVNYKKKIEVKIKEICEITQVTHHNQIKSECQFRDLVDSIEFYKKKL